jgi:hypothetical protein
MSPFVATSDRNVEAYKDNNPQMDLIRCRRISYSGANSLQVQISTGVLRLIFYRAIETNNIYRPMVRIKTPSQEPVCSRILLSDPRNVALPD